MLVNGDFVVMHTCGEAEHYNGKIWTCRGNQFTSTSGSQVVFLEGFSGYFLAKYLQKVIIDNDASKLEALELEVEHWRAIAESCECNDD